VLPIGSSYSVVTTAPVATSQIPYTIVYPPNRGQFYYYANGFFYQNNGGSYVIVYPEKGTAVPYLPNGYTTFDSNGLIYYRFGGLTYRPYYNNGHIMYIVD
jgi:hypothetical protein